MVMGLRGIGEDCTTRCSPSLAPSKISIRRRYAGIHGYNAANTAQLCIKTEKDTLTLVPLRQEPIGDWSENEGIDFIVFKELCFEPGVRGDP